MASLDVIDEALRGMRERYDPAAASELVEVLGELYGGKGPVARLLLGYYRLALVYLAREGRLDEAERLTRMLVEALQRGDQRLVRTVAKHLEHYAGLALGEG